MNIGIITSRASSISKAKLALGGALIIFVVATVAIFIGFQSEIRPSTDRNTELGFEAKPEVPAVYSYDSFDRSADTEGDSTVSVSDFGSRLDVADERLVSIEKSVSQMQSELSHDRDLKAETLQSLYSEVQSLKGRVAELASIDSTLDDSLKQMKTVLQKMQVDQRQDSRNELPVVGLKLLSVSIWDDGAVAIVSLGNRKTGLSVGNFFAGLKVEDISVAEQSLTLYEPSTDRLYTLYADAIVYKEAHTQ